MKTGDSGGGGRSRPAPSRRERYVLQKRPLGTGGFAEVFPAIERETGQEVAFKRLRTRDPEALRRFRREIEVQRSLQHQHVMPVLDVDPLFHWYTMPRAVASLKELLPRLSPAEVAQVIREAGAGLAAGHARQLTHRDVTPGNILALREPDGTLRWVIADFGLVRLPLGQSGTFKTEGPLGTVRFIAPEVQRDPRSATARSDIFALGMVAQVACELHGWGPEAGLERFIRAATQADPLQRPVSVAAALELLRPLELVMAPTFLVWTLDAQGAQRTVLVRARADAEPEVLGRCEGIYLCDGGRLLEWRYSSHRIKLAADWDALHEEGPLGREQDAPIEDVSLVEFDTGNSVLVTPIEPRFRADGYIEWVRRTLPLGGAGPFLFVFEEVRWNGGGAHGNTDMRFYVVDARTGLAVDSLSAAEFAQQFESERRTAMEGFLRDELFMRDSLAEQTLDDVELTLYQPVVGRDGQAALELQFTCSTYYAASDWRWSSYTRSERVRTERIPERLREVLQTPPALRPFLGQLQEALAVGWSRVSDEVRVEGWLALFSSGRP
jgi:hypothetical protein